MSSTQAERSGGVREKKQDKNYNNVISNEIARETRGNMTITGSLGRQLGVDRGRGFYNTM